MIFAIGMVLASAPAVAGRNEAVDLSAFVNAGRGDLGGPRGYPAAGSILNIGGVDFLLPTFNPKGDVGIVRTSGVESITVPLPGGRAQFIYVVLNSEGGIFSKVSGTIAFNSSVSTDFLRLDLQQGSLLRDFFDGRNNNSAINAFASVDFVGGERMDVYRFFTGNLPDIASLTLTSSGVGGQPFLQAATLRRFASSPAPVPEPGTWATMLTGAGVLGMAARRRRGTSAARVHDRSHPRAARPAPRRGSSA